MSRFIGPLKIAAWRLRYFMRRARRTNPKAMVWADWILNLPLRTAIFGWTLLRQTFDIFVRIVAVVLAVWIVGQLTNVTKGYVMRTLHPTYIPASGTHKPADIVIFIEGLGFRKVCEMDIGEDRVSTDRASYRSFSSLAAEGGPLSGLFSAANATLNAGLVFDRTYKAVWSHYDRDTDRVSDACIADLLQAIDEEKCPMIVTNVLSIEQIHPKTESFSAIDLAEHCIIAAERPRDVPTLPDWTIATIAEQLGFIRTVEIQE